MNDSDRHHEPPRDLPPQALAAWRERLGRQYVITDGEHLDLANQATFATPHRSRAILEPADRDEIAACLKIANQFRIPLYPISTGRNWGYGSRVPTRDRCVLLSLARLDRIVDYHEDLAYVTVEPGVTFRRLTEFLWQQKSRLLPPITGANPEASLIGNTLERGIGKGPYEDMAAHSHSYEVVLPTGQILTTGLAGFPGALAAPLTSNAPGPSLQGLFQQSNLGVITRMTLWLDPAPEWRQLIIFLISDDATLSPVIEGLRKILQRRSPRLQIELVNDYRYLSQTQQFPYEAFDGSAALSKDEVKETGLSAVNARWIGGATVWAESREELELQRRMLIASLPAPVESSDGEEPSSGLESPLSHDGLQSAYWRKRQPMPETPHPDRDRCGVMWLAPVLPMLGSVTQRAIGQVETIILDHGLEPSISLRLMGGRSIRAVIGLLYDRDPDGMDERAAACYDAVRQALYCQGLYPYRLGIRDMESLPAADAGSRTVLRALKDHLDPHGILAPGRYRPGNCRRRAYREVFTAGLENSDQVDTSSYELIQPCDTCSMPLRVPCKSPSTRSSQGSPSGPSMKPSRSPVCDRSSTESCFKPRPIWRSRSPPRSTRRSRVTQAGTGISTTCSMSLSGHFCIGSQPQRVNSSTRSF
jgi:4-cresol dehydrogenase (hydroxylating)